MIRSASPIGSARTLRRFLAIALLIAAALATDGWAFQGPVPTSDETDATREIEPEPDFDGDSILDDETIINGSNRPAPRFDDFENWYGYESPIRIGLLAGETYAMPGTMLTMELFRPLTNLAFGDNETITYFNGRLGLNGDRQVVNLGVGTRQYIAATDTILDGNLWYDIDHTEDNLFYQIVLGGQAQIRNASLRLHYYIPTGDKTQTATVFPATNTPFYQGTNLVFQRTRTDETALHGYDAELGFIQPTASNEYHFFAGIYHFESEDGNDVTIDGVSGRASMDLFPGFRAGVQVTHDDVTNSSALLMFNWELSSQPREYDAPTIRQRMGDSAGRNYNMVIIEDMVSDPLIATDAVTGNPIEIIHARSGGGTGSGRVLTPFNDLGAAATAAGANGNANIILAHAGSVFTGNTVVVPDGHQLLGEGQDYTVNTAEFGTVTLPRPTGLTAAPVLMNSPGDAITLGDSSIVNNFAIQNAGGIGILGDAVDGTVMVSNVDIDGALDGIQLRNSQAGAVITFDTLSIANTTNDGIDLNAGASGSRIDFNGVTTIDNPTGAGVAISNSNSTVNFQQLSISNFNLDPAIDILQNSGNVTFAQPLALDNANASPNSIIRIRQSGGDVTFDDVTITDTNRMTVGAPAVSLLTNTNDISFNSLDVTTTNGGALSAVYSGTLNGAIRINDGTISAVNDVAISLQTVMELDIALQSVSVTSTGTPLATGIRIIDSGNAAFNDRFLIVGSDTMPGAGGVMTNVDVGVLAQNSDDIFLNFLQIDSNIAGVQATDVDNLTVNELTLTSASDNWIGIDVTKSFTAHEGQNTLITGNMVNTAMGLNQIGIDLDTNRTLPPVDATIGGNSITLLGAGSTGINLLAVGNNIMIGDEGEIDLFNNGQSNFVNAATPFVATENMATINGQILINGVLMP